jgi:diguanylate cyclase (GGDEF)-like protein
VLQSLRGSADPAIMVDVGLVPVDSVTHGEVGGLAFEVPIVAASTPIGEVDRLLRKDARLRAVIVGSGADVRLLTREHLELMLSGPFGYGRSLHCRATAGELAPPCDVQLPASLSLAEASRRLLARDPDSRYQDALVTGGSRPAVVCVSTVFEQLSVLFRHVALHDPLTSLPNRRMLDQYAAGVVEAGHDLARIAILYIDLDGFKLVNDSLGHRAGDEVLTTFASRLRSCVRDQDLIARLGGDEFAALLVDVSEVQAMAVAERIVLNAAAPFIHEGEPLYVSASVGVAMADDVHHERGFSQIDAMLRLADGAMLQAKRSGKRRVERLPLGTEADTFARRGLIRRRLRDALNLDEGLSLHYQPKLDLRSGGTAAVEALLRWTDAELGAVSPAEFIPIAEDSDQIHQLGLWVLDRACAQAARWLHTGRPRVVSINVSAVQLRSPHLAQSVKDGLDAWALPPELLRVEITESSAVLDLPSTLHQLGTLRRLGVQVELDDFGTGYSSLSMLRELPLTAVKIDKSFIDNIDTDPADAALVKGVIEAAHALSLSVTAEGVERAEQLRVLREIGCDTAQGFLIARPVAAQSLPDAATGQKFALEGASPS